MSDREEYIIDDSHIKYDPDTFERVFPDNPRYDELPDFDYNTKTFIYD